MGARGQALCVHVCVCVCVRVRVCVCVFVWACITDGSPIFSLGLPGVSVAHREACTPEPVESACCYWNGYRGRSATRALSAPSRMRSRTRPRSARLRCLPAPPRARPTAVLRWPAHRGYLLQPLLPLPRLPRLPSHHPRQGRWPGARCRAAARLDSSSQRARRQLRNRKTILNLLAPCTERQQDITTRMVSAPVC